jgi:hypothetical protein
MCWYSQHERLNTRRAIEGEELEVRDFPNHGRWLASAEDPDTPVCIPNGCMLRISNIPRNLQKELKLNSEAVAEFREIHQRSANSLLARIFLPPKLCFDVVLFQNGRALQIPMFSPEMQVDILSPAVVAPVGAASEENERIYV